MSALLVFFEAATPSPRRLLSGWRGLSYLRSNYRALRTRSWPRAFGTYAMCGSSVAVPVGLVLFISKEVAFVDRQENDKCAHGRGGEIVLGDIDVVEVLFAVEHLEP